MTTTASARWFEVDHKGLGQILERRGKAAGAPVQGNEACMIVGGSGETWWSSDAEERAINDVVRERGSTSAVHFNRTQTLPEVVSALEAAADLLDKEGE